MKKVIFLFAFITFLFSNNCDKKLFTLHISNPVSFKSILSDLASECNINVVLKDANAKKMINGSVEFINVENVNFKELLNVLFNNANLFYNLKGNTIVVSYNKTKTYRLDFIPNSIRGVANIDSNDNTIKTDYKFDFWDNLKRNIVQILKNTDASYKEPIIDKNSGLITVTGNRNQIEEINKYIKDLNHRLHKEVLIDVKIYSVTLSSSHKTGIDWSQLSLSLEDKSVPIRSRNIFGANSVFKQATFNVGGLLNFLAQNGNVNSISNPKIVTLNNQKALIKVGDTIYYKYASEITTDNNGNPSTEYTIDSKFVGVLLDITPQISDDGEIILSINPRISAFKDTTQLSNTSREMPPDTQDNTMISVVKLRNNDTLVLGGLITDDKQLKINGVPVLKEIPVLKYLFSSEEKVTTKKELVFVITPHIIDLKKHKKLQDFGYKELPNLEDLDVR